MLYQAHIDFLCSFFLKRISAASKLSVNMKDEDGSDKCKGKDDDDDRVNFQTRRIVGIKLHHSRRTTASSGYRFVTPSW